MFEDRAGDLLVRVERLLELDPAFLAARLVARDDGLAEGVFDALEIDLDLIADLDVAFAARAGEFLQATRPSVFRPTSMMARSFSIPTTMPLTTEPFVHLGLAEALGEERGEIVAGGVHAVGACHTVYVPCEPVDAPG